MKKLLGFAAVAVALCSLFVSCASSSGAKADAPASIHPREYVFDVIDGGSSTVNLVWNTYGPNYQATPFFSSLVKKDKPQAGDTVTFKMRATSNVDLPLIVAYPCSTAPSWTGLGESVVVAENVVAGEPFECEFSFVLHTKMGSDFALCMQYDNEDQEVKAGCASVLTLERICESTDTTKEVPAAPHNSYVTVNLSKYAAFCQIETNHPWVNGAQDMSIISNYQATPEVTAAYGDDLPQPGDVMHITWKAVSDIDIERIFVRPVDCSAAANYWKELTKPDWNSIKTEEQLAEEAAAAAEAGEEVEEVEQEEGLNSNMILVENVQAGVPFDVELDVVITTAPTAQVNLCLWYDVGMGEGPAIIKLVRD